METKQLKIKVHSISSVITNSSEMIYVVDDGKTEEQILEILKPFIDMDIEEGNTSGTAGDVSVRSYDENGEIYTILDIDWDMEHTREAINSLLGYDIEC